MIQYASIATREGEENHSVMLATSLILTHGAVEVSIMQMGQIVISIM